ncbi:MAG TPA: M56 family metallopeptidase [Niastella sp.]
MLLQKETFFRLNRWMMVVCLVLAFGLPLIRVPQQWSFHKAAVPVVVQDADLSEYNNLPPVSSSSPAVTVPQKQSTFSWHQIITWVKWLYWFGVAAFGINFLVQVVILLYRAYTSPVIKDGRFRIVELSGDKAPCSFGNNIFINPEKYDWDTYSQILMHEKIHVQEGHSLDLLLAELVIIFQWFNPFAWLYRKELENNLEFLTDDQLLHHPEVEKTVYQLSLLKVSAPHFPLHVTTNYNQSLLKKRIAMMNVKKSNVHTTWKYLFLFPVLVLFISLLNEPVAVAQTAGENKENKEKIWCLWPH